MGEVDPQTTATTIAIRNTRREFIGSPIVSVGGASGYKSINYANFVLDSFKKHTNFEGGNIDFLFIVNDPNEKLINYFDEKKIPYLLIRNNDPNEYYLNRVYRAWNFASIIFLKIF